MAGLADFLVALPQTPPVDLLPYHTLGKAKYRALGAPIRGTGMIGSRTTRWRSWRRCWPGEGLRCGSGDEGIVEVEWDLWEVSGVLREVPQCRTPICRIRIEH